MRDEPGLASDRLATPDGLRARNRERTATALERAAWELVAESGFEAVTAEAVAERAHVSRRTFFNYYPRVELVLQERMRATIAGLVQRFIGRPEGEDVQVSLATVLSEPFDADLLRNAVIVFGQAPHSPGFRLFFADAQAAQIAQIAQALQKRGEPWSEDLAAQVVAGAVMASCSVSTMSWLDQSGGVVNDATRQLHLDLLRQAFAHLFITFGGSTTLTGTDSES